MAKVGRLFQTVRHLRVRQILYQVYYRLSGKLRSRPEQGARQRVPGNSAPQPPGGEEQGDQRAVPPTPGAVTFDFLNRPVTFRNAEDIDWNYASEGKLWTYHLNYFDFLLDPAGQGYAGPEPETLIHHWIDREGTHADGWEPYPTSLRLVNWLAYYERKGGELPPAVHASVQRQYANLGGKIEYHLDGNHLLENAIALTYTAYRLGDEDGKRAYAALLERQLRAQYLEDGMHYELSPAYHLLLLHRWLLTYPCFSVPTLAPATAPHLPRNLHKSLERQLAWTRNFVTNDGRYAHFNDSNADMAPAAPDLLRRAAALGLTAAEQPLTDSGYRHWTTARADLWIDAAVIGPDHIPGHAHADNLTFVLHVDGRPVIVDPGVSTYEQGERRTFERSTAAHNTVTLGGRNSSDVWASFRVGRRARTTISHEFGRTLRARHAGYGTAHRREFGLTDQTLTVVDRLAGNSTGVAHLHFDYTCDVELISQELKTPYGIFQFTGGTPEVRHYQQATGWNTLRRATVVTIPFTGELISTFTLSAAPSDNV